MSAVNQNMLIVSAPSGSGKTTLVRRVMEALPELAFSISATTRPLRGQEVDGVDYHFLDEATFKSRVEAGDFLEWEEVYPGRFYGSLNQDVEAIWSAGQTVVFDIDVVGGRNLKSRFGDRALAIFIQAPSMKVLEQRLRQRGTEDEVGVRSRLDKASQEMRYASDFDLRIVNDDLEVASQELIEAVKGFLRD